MLLFVFISVGYLRKHFNLGLDLRGLFQLHKSLLG